VRRVLVQLGIGLGVGVVGTQLFDRVFNDPAETVPGAEMTDPAALTLVAFSIGAVALLACLRPIWRATRVDPIVALRVE